MLMQQLWRRGLDWDEPVPHDLQKEWHKISSSLPSLSNMTIPRRVLCDDPIQIELHSFCDASMLAYGACVYQRSTDKQGNITVNLLCAKSRVAPTKPPLTIPKLELLGALLSANLTKTVLESLRCPISSCTHWTDSTVVLAWLHSSPSKLKPFVANKTVEILEHTNLSSWQHVPTSSNPADFISRGVSAEKLPNLSMWWSGPSFLALDQSLWPVPATKNNINHLPEMKILSTTSADNPVLTDDSTPISTLPATTADDPVLTDDSHSISNYPETNTIKSTIKNNNNYDYNHLPSMNISLPTQVDDPFVSFVNFSRFSKLKRTYAYVIRFVHNLKHPSSKIKGPLNVEELQKSFSILLRHAQMQSFPKEYSALSNQQSISSKNNLLSLTPFLDKEGVMRVGGRLDSSTYSFTKKHPAILDSNHHLTKLIFQYEHLRLLHAGPALMLSTVREYVWPTSGRRLARAVARACVACRRLRPAPLAPRMGELPAQRVTPAPAFQTIGMDYAGPFTILNKKGRGARTTKCYLCLFICFRYKCVHLEAVSDLSMEAFILSFRRFISRRGKPLEVFSDNGRNFVAAAKEINKFINDNVNNLSDFAANEGIKFNFHPAYAPHFSGLAEAGIKSAKHHIKRVLGLANLTFEELTTLFAQVEATMNSRPLYPLSSSPQDFLPLTPGHFLIGRPMTSLPSPAIPEDTSRTIQSRYKRLEMLRQSFWRRWQHDYIAELQQRTKWKENHNNLKIGDLVIIQEDNVPPLCWRLGRIKQLYPGADGIARVADINTSRGCVRRALTRLCPLLP
ncbi:uncharacterized protein LOC126379136 [Pectinophora gossypiella]|uniref:uncharacterized protein LOC126379136 n=1 Tax=Pectinophora gossypiella TaxID=13191 RepID=UPI00214F3635|nr:uncharacterized protein LOC126379136 [Pectinophora gossypiella]